MYFKFVFVLLCIKGLSAEVGSESSINSIDENAIDENVVVFTVASEETEGYLRYIRSARHYGIDVQTLGMGKEWKGGDMSKPGGGYKIKLLKEAMEQYKDSDKIIIFTDSYDVIFISDLKEILLKFQKFDAGVLFSSEHYCWPDVSLREKYPHVLGRGARFLNSGLFMGHSKEVYEVLNHPIEDTDDDQLFYTKIFLNEEEREKLRLKLDHRSEIFQNLHGAEREVKMDFDEQTGKAFLRNMDFESSPLIVHGNGPSKVVLNGFGNYLADAFLKGKCNICDDALKLEESNLPIVTMAVFVNQPMPFFEEFLDRILAIDYPKEKLHLFIHNNAKYHESLVETYVQRFGGEYKSVKQILVDDSVHESSARDLAVQYASKMESAYLFSVDVEAHIDNPNVLKELIKRNKDVIAPLMSRPKDAWSNFWGALNDQGFYARSHNYLDIVNERIRGIWNVPFISSCYLVKKSAFPYLNYVHEALDPDMAMCYNLRQKNIFMHVINLEHYGHLVNGEKFNTKLTRPDFYMIFSNQADWEQRYIHQDYPKLLAPNVTYDQPCPDVYRFPIVTEQFCKDLVAIMEAYGKWSDGSNNDNRLQGGYEAVPTRDIHMNQVGLEPMWLKFLQVYVRPLQEAVFMGYFHDPPRSLMNFMVRYRPDEQPLLRPHHDSSTYTINVAMNKAGVDFTGGGCRFLRYNCSVLDTKMGWMLMHPGRLTHYHEGLRTLSGTRYIMVSFIDP